MLLMARLINDCSTKVTEKGACFAQQYLLKKGIKIFGQRGRATSVKEMNQLRHQSCFTPIYVAGMTPIKQRKAEQAVVFLGEKNDRSEKAQCVYNQKPTRERLSREHSLSPTAALDSIMLTGVIDAHEGRNIITSYDIPILPLSKH